MNAANGDFVQIGDGDYIYTTQEESTPPTPWEVNGDGTVNILDLVFVAGQFGQSGDALKADINGDGTVNILDLVLVASHFGEDTSN